MGIEPALRTDDAGVAAVPSPAAAAVSPTLPGLALTHRLQECGLPFETLEPRQRFRIDAVLGRGGTATVYSVADGSLRRRVAVKVLEAGPAASLADVASFIAEARVTAALDHPHVLPVHDIDVTQSGDVFFVMKQIDGRSLGDAIAESTPRLRHPSLTLNRVVSIMIAIGQALAYAHHRGFVHQDVKPGNIMLGAFGEVLLVDWGSATRLSGERQQLCGTPIYMAPEQARREPVDARTDVYAFGGTLLHALLLRYPILVADEASFWRAKAVGAFDEPRAEERALVPADLLAIAAKALAADPADRYQRIEDAVADLDRYQAGLAVSVVRESLLRRLRRWHRHHAERLWLGVLVCAVVVACTVVVAGDRMRQWATWGPPVVALDAADPASMARWRPLGGRFAADGHDLVDASTEGSLLTCRRRFANDCAIEFTGEIPAGVPTGDLSVFWDRDEPSDEGALEPARRLLIQYGAHGGASSRISNASQFAIALDASPQAPGVHRVRVEIVANRLSLMVDGRRVCEFEDQVAPLTGGWFSIYSFYAGHRFRDVRLYERQAAELLPATALGDFAARIGDERAAADEYARVAQAHPGTALAAESDYKRGALGWNAGRRDEAFAAWDAIRDEPWRTLVQLRREQAWCDAGDLRRSLDDLRDLLERSGGRLRREISAQWATTLSQLARDVEHGAKPDGLAMFFDAGDRLDLDQGVTAQPKAEALVALGRYQAVLDRFPFLPLEVVEATVAMGHPERALDVVHDPFFRRDARLDMGMPERGQQELPPAERPKSSHYLIAHAALWRHPQYMGDRGVFRLMRDGRFDDALELFGDDRRIGLWPRHRVGLDAWIAGDRDRAHAAFAVPEGWLYRQPYVDFAHAVMVPFLEEIEGRAGGFQRVRAEYADHPYAQAGSPWAMVRYLLGEIDDDAFDVGRSPWASADLLLCRAVRHDRRGDAAAAIAAYRAWSDLVPDQRSYEPEPVRERFAAWRLAQLTSAR